MIIVFVIFLIDFSIVVVVVVVAKNIVGYGGRITPR